MCIFLFRFSVLKTMSQSTHTAACQRLNLFMPLHVLIATLDNLMHNHQCFITSFSCSVRILQVNYPNKLFREKSFTVENDCDDSFFFFSALCGASHELLIDPLMNQTLLRILITRDWRDQPSQFSLSSHNRFTHKLACVYYTLLVIMKISKDCLSFLFCCYGKHQCFVQL